MEAILRSLLRTARFAGLTVAVAASLGILAGTLPSLLGYDSFVIRGGSMAPSIPDGSIAVAARTPVEELRAGDVITFRPSREASGFVTHRIVKVRAEETIEGVTVTTMGDANETVDPVDAQLTGAVPRMIFFVPLVGRLLEFLRSPAGTVVSMVAPLGLIAFSGMRRSRPDEALLSAPSAVALQERATEVAAAPVRPTPRKPIVVAEVTGASPGRVMLLIENRSTQHGIVFPKADPRLQVSIRPGGWIALDRSEDQRLLECGWMTITPEVRWYAREALHGLQLVPPVRNEAHLPRVA